MNRPNHEEYDSNNHFTSNKNHHDTSNYNYENNYSSVNSRMFKNDEFNSVQIDFNYNVQMGVTYKISSMIKNTRNTQTLDQVSILQSKLQELEKFEDTTFKSSFSSTKEKIHFKSPKDFIDGDLCLFPKDSNGIFLPSKLDVNNHAFISAMNLLLTNPSLLSRLFENETVNEVGIYGVWLCENGSWTLVQVDDRVPVDKDSNYALNEISSKEKCIFHMILEKALAKFYHSYENLFKVNISSLLNGLTGSHVEIKNLIDLQSNDDVWNLLKKWREANYLIFFQNNGEFDSKKSFKEEYLCYSLVDCIEIIPNDYDENIERILRFRTPIKGNIFEGKFNKNSNLSADLKKKLKINEENISFCLTFEEAMKIFTDVGVCKAQNKIDSMYEWLRVKNHENFLLKFRLDSPTNIILSFNQKENENNKNHYIRALLAKDIDSSLKEVDSLQVIGGDYSNKKMYIEKNSLESGDYVLVIEVLWNEGDKEITIGWLYENNAFNQNNNFEMILKKPNELLEIQKKLMKNYAKSMESNTMRIRDYSSNNEPSIKIYNDMVFGFSYFYYINQSNKKLKEKIMMTALKNLSICEPFKDNYSIEIELDPKEELMVLYKYEKNGKDFSYALMIKASLERANSVISSSQIIYEGQSSEIKMMTLSKLKNSTFSMNEQNPKDELLKMIKEKIKPSKRMWKNQEVDVLVYTHVHKDGLVMLYCNNCNKKFHETLHFAEMKHLEFNHKQSNGNKDKVEIMLDPGKSDLLLFNKTGNENFSFRFKNVYKII